MEAIQIVDILQRHAVYLTGGRDRRGGPILTLPATEDSSTVSSDGLLTCINYLSSIPSDESAQQGFSVIVDNQYGDWKQMKLLLSVFHKALGDRLYAVYVVNPDKHRVSLSSREKTHFPFKYEPLLVGKLRNYISESQLIIPLGGTMKYCHDDWLRIRISYEKYVHEARVVLAEMDVQTAQLRHSMDGNDPPITAQNFESHWVMLTVNMLDAPRQLAGQGESLRDKLQTMGSQDMASRLTHDEAHMLRHVEQILEDVASKLRQIDDMREQKKHMIGGRVELQGLEAAIKTVVEWVNGPAEKLLASQVNIGTTYEEALELRKQHEQLELKCTDTYATYAELRHTADEVCSGPAYESEGAEKLADIAAQRNYMDSVCRSYATRLERRRNLVIISVRFHRHAQQLTEMLDNLQQFLHRDISAETVNEVEEILSELQVQHDAAGAAAEQTFAEAQNLLDVLSLPMKDAFGRDVTPDHTPHMEHVERVAAALRDRHSRIDELVEMRRLKLQQLVQLRTCERDAEQAIRWLQELCVMTTKDEADREKGPEQLNKLRQTAKGTYDYGKQLLQAALVLRRSLRDDLQPNHSQAQRLADAWRMFSQGVGETAERRLHVDAFHQKANKVLSDLEDLLTALSRALQKEITLYDLITQYSAARDMLVAGYKDVLTEGRTLLERLAVPPLASQQSSGPVKANDAQVTESIQVKMALLQRKIAVLNTHWLEQTRGLHLGPDGVVLTPGGHPWQRGTSPMDGMDSMDRVMVSHTAGMANQPPMLQRSNQPIRSPAAGPSSAMDEMWQKVEDEMIQSNEWIRVRIQQMEPDLMEVGATLEEARALRQEHNELLVKLNLKQKDVAELLTRADDLSSQQRSYQQVYEAMAESLGEAWKDLNAQLEYRKMLLDQSINFHESALQFSSKMEQAQHRFNQMGTAQDVDNARYFLQQHQELKKSILEASMHTLQEGQSLLERIREMGLHADIQNRHATTAACYGIEHLLELLHDRRRHLEDLWVQRRLRLEACLQMLLLDQEVEKVSKWYNEVGGAYLNKTDLGENLFAAQMLQEEHIRFEMQAREIQDTVLRLVRTADQLVHSEQYRSEEGIKKRLLLVDEQSENFTLRLDTRRKNLSLAVTFYLLTKTALSKLDEIEQQLSATDLPRNSAALADLHAYMSGAIIEVSAPALRDGRALLERVGRQDPGSQGISTMLDQLQERCTKLEAMCMARYEVGEQSQAFNQFQDKCNALNTWLSKIGQATLNQHTDMGTNLSTSRDFLETHERLDEDIRDKMSDVDGLSQEARELMAAGSPADTTVERTTALHSQWNTLHELVGRRIKLALTYVTFHKKAQQLAIEMDALEQYLKIEKVDPSHITDSSIGHKEEKYGKMDESFRTVEAKGKLFIKEAEETKVDSHLDTQRAVSIVETIISQFVERRYLITEYYEHWKVHVSTGREFHSQWQKFIEDARKTIDWMMAAEKEFFLPTIAGNLGKTITDAQLLQKKLEDFGPVAKKAQEEIETHLKRAELLSLKGDTKGEKEQIVGELLKVHTRFQARISEYQLLLNMTQKFFQNLQQLDKLIEDTEKEYESTPLPSDVTRTQVMLREHEMNRNQMRQLINLSSEEGEQIVVRVRQQDSEAHAKDGVQNVLSLTEERRHQWEKAWDEQKVRLEQNVQLCQFYYDLKQIHNELDELQRQVNARRGSYGHSLSSVVMTSQAFKNFEATVELIEANVRRFISTADMMLRSENVDARRIRAEVDGVQTKWSRFYSTIRDYRAALDSSTHFFEIMDQCEASITESSKFLLQIGQKATDCKTSRDADNLLADLQNYKQDYAQAQNEKLSEMSRITVSMYGPNQGPQKMQHIVDKNAEMLSSFGRAADEVSVLRDNLVKKEQILDEMNKVVETANQPRFVQLLQNAEINEGNRFTFECRVQCDDASPRIEWFKDDVPLKSPDYEMSYRDGTCKLTIDETFSEDTAKYTCKATTEAGNTQTSAQLKVRELIQQKVVPPDFSRHLKSVDLPEGTQLMFECHVTGVPTPAVSWFRGADCIDNAPDYVITKVNGTCCLKIRRVTRENSARYTCRATNGGGEASSSATLTVIAVKKPYFHEPLKPVVAKEGESAKLECHFSAEPAPQIVWLRNDQPIEPSSTFRVEIESTYTTLHIREVYAEHVGTYVVVARNVGGETRTSCQLTVGGLHSTAQRNRIDDAPAVQQAAPQVASTAPPLAAPVFRQPLQDVEVMEGKRARLDCVIVSRPEPEVIWFHNDRPVKESADFELLFEGDRCSLIIREVYLEDSGDYRCLARNKMGVAESRCRLVVEALSELSDASMTGIGADSVAPKFTQLLKDIEAGEGDKVRFDCRVIGHPTPQVKWYRGRQQIVNSSDFQISCERELHSLTIPEAFGEDAGNYMVRATNTVGQAKCYVTLTVRPSSDAHVMKTRLVEMSHTTVNPDAVGEPPEFKKLFKDMRAKPGQACQFEVIITGRPKPKICWLFNNEPIVSPDYQITSSGDIYRLRIPEVFDEDAGRFSITAENECGKATCAALLVVVSETDVMPEEGSPPETPLAKDAFFKPGLTQPVRSPLAGPAPAKVTSKFLPSAPAPQPAPVAPKFAPVAAQQAPKPAAPKLVQPVSAPQKFVPAPAAPPAAPPAPKFVPKPAAPVAVAPPAPKFVPKPSPPAAMVPKPVIAQPVKPQLANAQPVSLTMSVPVPPQFLTTLRNMAAEEGTRVTLSGVVSGRPKPTIRWFRAGNELVDSADFEIGYTDDGRVSLTIPEVFEEDAGKYVCNAQNSAGSVDSSAELIVKASLVPPEFLERAQTREVKEGEAVTFTVRVRGQPTPDVTWYREGSHIVSSPDFEITQQGDVHSLTIPEVFYEDSGKFSVNADNSAGRATCTAELIVEAPSGMEGSLSPSPPMSRSPSIGMSPDRAALYRPTHARSGSSREATPQKAPIPQFTKPLQDKRVRQGDKVTLECSIPLFPAPESVTWARNDVPIRDSADYNVSCRNGVCTLVIVEVFPEDSGRFTCTVTINGATNVTAMYLTVEAIPPAPKAPPQVPQAPQAPLSARAPPPPPRCAPNFETRLTNQPLQFGQTAYFECRVRGEPAPEILWTRRGNPLVDKARYKSTYDQYKGITTLTILSTCPEDEGEYTCTAINSLGESSTSASLLAPDPYQTWLQQTPSPVVAAPPPPVKSPVVSELQARTAEKPTFYKPMSERALERRMSDMDVPDEPRRGSFHVSSFEKRLMQEIGMRDKNAPPAPVVSPQPSRAPAPQADARPPVFEQRLKNFQLMEGSDVTFVCKVSGTPKPIIQWYHEGRPIRSSNRHQMDLTPDGYCSLRVRVAFADDAGHYTCCATNAVGRDTCSAELLADTGAPRPVIDSAAPASVVDSTSYVAPETLDRMMQSPAGSRRSSQEPGGVSEKHFRPRFRRVPTDRDAVESEMTRFDSIVSGRPMPELLWYRDGVQVHDDRMHKIVINEDGIHSLIIPAVSAGDAGVYTCIARNKAGEDTFQVRLNVQRRIATCMPRFVERMSNVCVREGEPVELRARADGAPTPMMSWQKDGRMIDAADATYKIETNDGASMLRIDSAAPSDTAWYQCSAVNVAGTASNRARLIVQVEPAPPTPERKLVIPSRTTPTPTREVIAPKPVRPVEEPPKFVPAPERVTTPVELMRPAQLPLKQPVAPSTAEIVLSPPPAQPPAVSDAIPWRHVGAPQTQPVVLKQPQVEPPWMKEPVKKTEPQRFETFVPAPAPPKVMAPPVPVQPSVAKVDVPFVKPISKPTPPKPPPKPKFVGGEIWSPKSKPAPPKPPPKPKFVGGEIWSPKREPIPATAAPEPMETEEKKEEEDKDAAQSQPPVQRPPTTELIENGIEPKPDRDDMYEKEAPRPPVFKTQLRPLRQLVESQPAHFECRLVPIGDPDMQVDWFKDGKLLCAGHRFKTASDFGYVALDILYTYPEDNGIYMCRATNKSGTAETQAPLQCKGKRSVITETQLPEGVESIQQLEAMEDAIHREPIPRDSEEQVPPAPPVFDLLPEPVQVEEGETAKFMVKISGHPRPRLTWWVNGAMIVNSQRFRVWYDGMIHLMEIPKVREYDAGTIRVVAKNPMGEAECSSSLSVIPQEDWRARLRHAPKSASQVEAEKTKAPSLKSFELQQAFMKPKTTVVEIRAFERASQDKLKMLREGDIQQGADTIIQTHTQLAPCDPSRELREHEPTVRTDSEQHMIRARAMLGTAPQVEPHAPAAPEHAVPSFVARLADVSAVEGEAVKLQVDYVGMPVPKVQWYREGIEIQPSRDFQTTTQPGHSFLHIPEVFPEDTGCFSVRVSNPYGAVTCSCRLTVTEDTSSMMKEVAPEFRVQMHDITITVGEPATFDCQISGHPRPEVYWVKDGHRLDAEDNRWKMIVENDQVTLLIYESNEQLQGRYECVLVNKMGKASCSATLTTKGKDVTKIMPAPAPSEPTVIVLQTPPQLVEQLHDQEVNEGEQAIFKCHITAVPEPLVQWYYKDQVIKPSKYFQMSSQAGVHTLVIAGAFPEDEGVYKCVARNQSGEVTCIAHLSVIPLAAEAPMEPPTFEKPIGAAEACEGTEVRFEAIVLGVPLPEVCWLREQMVIQSSEEFQILQDGNKCTLLIKAVFPEDSGKFTCRATNPAGIAECSAELFVEGKPGVEPPAIMKQAPQIKKAPSPVREVVAGNCTKLIVQLDAYPPPRFSWFLNGERLTTSQRVKISYENGVVTLIIMDARPEDGGEYTLKASNEIGETTCTTVINISSGERFVELPMDTQQVTISSTKRVEKMEYKEVTPMFKQPLKPEVRITENSVARLECEVLAYPPPVITWHVNGVQIEPSAKYTMQVEGDRSVLLISQVTSDDTGVYTCRAVSDLGEAVTSTTLYVTVAEHRVEPPTFSVQLQPVSATDGREVVLACVVTGTPVADVRWYHNDRNIDDSDDFVITYDRATGRTELVIVDCLPDDQGVFKCVARNSGGQAMTQCILTVTPDKPAAQQPAVYDIAADVTETAQKTVTTTTAATQQKTTVVKKTVKRQSGQPPRFIKPIQPQVVREGENAEFVANVSGAPQPEITWLKDKVEVKPSDRYAMHFDRDSGTCTLTIKYCEPLDVGVFSCRASNAAGKATCTANVVVVPPDAEVTITEKTVSVKKEKVTIVGTQETRVVENSPTFAKPLLPHTEVTEGDDLTLECRAVSEPEASFVWYRSGLEITPTQRTHIASESGVSTLTITQVTLEDSGEYVCTARNMLGHANTRTMLLVKRHEIEQLTKPIAAESPSERPLTNGVPLQMTPIAQQPQQPQQPTAPPGDVSVVTSSWRQEQTLLRHQQEYFSSTDVPDEAPSFVMPLTNQSVHDGDRALFRVLFRGHPAPSVQWFFNSRPLTNSSDFQINVDTAKGESTLLIVEVFPDDEGDYMCRAENTFGTAITHCHLFVKLPSSSSEDEANEKLVSQTVEVVKTERPVAVRETRRFSETIAIEHRARLAALPALPARLPPQRSELRVRQESVPRGMRLNVEQRNVQLVRKAEAEPTHRQQVKVAITKQRRYSETIAIDLSRRASLQSAQRLFQTAAVSFQRPTLAELKRPEPKHRQEIQLNLEGSRPRFLVELSPVKVMDGDEVRLTCRVVASPMPDVVWYHNGKLVEDNPDFRTVYSRDTGDVQLLIMEVFPQDTGSYECVATNCYGRAVTSTTVVVEAYEYVADSEEATASQTESLMSTSSMDEADFQQKTKRFLANMQVMRQTEDEVVAPLYKDEVVDELEIEEHGYEETIQMADVKWQVQKRAVMTVLVRETEEHAEDTKTTVMTEWPSSEETRLPTDMAEVAQPTESHVEAMEERESPEQAEVFSSEEEDETQEEEITIILTQPVITPKTVSHVGMVNVPDSEEAAEIAAAAAAEEQSRGEDIEIELARPDVEPQRESHVEPVQDRSELEAAAELPTDSEQMIEEGQYEVTLQRPDVADKTQSRVEMQDETLTVEMLHDIAVSESETTTEEVEDRKLATSPTKELPESHTDMQRAELSVEIAEAITDEVTMETTGAEDVTVSMELPSSEATTSMVAPLDESVQEESAEEITEPEQPESRQGEEIEVEMSAVDRSERESQHVDLVLEQQPQETEEGLDAVAAEPAPTVELTESEMLVLESKRQEESLVSTQQTVSSEEQVEPAVTDEELVAPAQTIVELVGVADTAQQEALVEPVEEGGARPEVVSEDGANGPREAAALTSMVDATYDAFASYQTTTLVQEQSAMVESDETITMVTPALQRVAGEMAERIVDEVTLESVTPAPAEAVTDVVPALEGVAATSLMAPVFKIPLSDVTVTDGDQALLECHVAGNPRPTVEWFMERQPIRASADFQITYEAGVCMLLVTDVLPEDEGEYSVRAVNEAGTCVSTAYLTVLPSSGSDGESVDRESRTSTTRLELEQVQGEEEKTETSTIEIDLAMQVLKEATAAVPEAPKFIIPLENKEIYETLPVTLECQVTGFPQPDITWYQDGKKLVSCDRMQLTEEVNGRARLHIEHATLEDEAEYMCEARNDAGVTTCLAELLVEKLMSTVERVILEEYYEIEIALSFKWKVCAPANIRPPL